MFWIILASNFFFADCVRYSSTFIPSFTIFEIISPIHSVCITVPCFVLLFNRYEALCVSPFLHFLILTRFFQKNIWASVIPGLQNTRALAPKFELYITLCTISLLSTMNKSSMLAVCPSLYLVGSEINWFKKLSRSHSMK